MKKSYLLIALLSCFLLQGCLSSGPEDVVRKQFELRITGKPEALDYTLLADREKAKAWVRENGFDNNPFGKDGKINSVEIFSTSIWKDVNENTKYVMLEAAVRGNDVETIFYTVVYKVVKQDGEWLVDFSNPKG